MRRNSASLFALAVIAGTLAGGCADEPSYLSGGSGGMRGNAFGAIASRSPAPVTEAPPRADAQLAAAPLPPAAATQTVDARLVVYSAGFNVVVADVPGSLVAIRKHAEQAGGYMQEVAGNAILIRVPAARFNDAVAFVERVGQIVDRQLRAQDVTEELHDLQTHIDNHEKLRLRFQQLLAKAEKVEDALKIETELARVTEELDKAKGKLRYLESQIAMSSLRIELNSPVPQRAAGNGLGLPFEWVNALGEGLVEGQVQQDTRQAGIFGHGPRFKPPGEFVRYYEDETSVEAINADGLRLRVTRQDNLDKAMLPFWASIVRKSLVEGRSLTITEEKTGSDVYTVRGTRPVGEKSLGYFLAMKRSDRRVVVFEAWGPAEQIDKQIQALRDSGLSVDAR